MVSEKLLEAYRRLSEPVTISLAILAIVFAVVQFFDSRIQKKEIKKVAESMSTSYIGEFPKNMENIIKVTAAATKKLDIMVDFAGYGNYSKPQDFEKYFQTLLNPHDGKRIKIRMLLYDKKAGLENRDRQLKPIFESEVGSDRFTHYFQVEHPKLTVPINYEKFSEELSQVEDEYEKRLVDKGIDVRHVSQALMFYVWIEDDEDAVFSFQSTQGGEREISFHTRDATLIKTFGDTFQRVWDTHVPGPSIVTHH